MGSIYNIIVYCVFVNELALVFVVCCLRDFVSGVGVEGRGEEGR